MILNFFFYSRARSSFLSNNKRFVNFKNFSNKAGGKLFKQLTNFNPGDETPKIFLKEHDFINHHNKFKNSLDNVHQTPEEQLEFFEVVVDVLVQPGGILTPQNVLSGVRKSLEYNSNAQEAVIALSTEVIKISNRFPLDPKAASGVKRIVEEGKDSLGGGLENSGSIYQHVELSEHPQFNEMADKFISKTNLGSGRVLESIDLLIEACKINELVTFLASSPLLAKGLGLHLFMVGYYSFSVEGSLKSFLSSVRDKVEWQSTPVFRSVKVGCEFIYKHKLKFMGTTSALVFTYHYFFNSTLFKILPQKNLVVTKTPIVVLENSPWVFRTPKSESNFLSVKDWLCQSAYMASNTLSSMIWASKQGVMDSPLPPEVKDSIREKANEVIPAIVDRLVEGIQPSKKI